MTKIDIFRTQRFGNINEIAYLCARYFFMKKMDGGAKESCPVFTGKVAHRLHIGFDDPDAFKGTEEEILPEFRRVRDEIIDRFTEFRNEIAKKTIRCNGQSASLLKRFVTMITLEITSK